MIGDSSDYGIFSSPAQSVSGGGGTGNSSSSSTTQIVPGMMGVYGQLLGLNQQNYGNILDAYGKGQQNAGQQLPGIYGGYGDVQGQVENTLGMGQVLGQNGNWGVAAPAAQAIGQAYAKNTANTTQQMTNAGLGNTTVGANLQNQNTLGAAQAYGGLGAQLAQTAAGYQSQLGMAGLGARMQGLGMQTGLSQAEGGALAGYHYGNTAGSLTGTNSQSKSENKQEQGSQSKGPEQTNPSPNSPGSSPYNTGGGFGGFQGGNASPGGGGALPVTMPGDSSGGFTSGYGTGQVPSGGYGGAFSGGQAGVTGQNYQPGQSAASVDPNTKYNMNFSQTGNGPGGPTTGFQGGINGQKMGPQAPNDLASQYPSANGPTSDINQGEQLGMPQEASQVMQNAGLSATDQQSMQAALDGMSPEDRAANIGYLQQGLKPTFGSTGQGANQHFVLIGWH